MKKQCVLITPNLLTLNPDIGKRVFVCSPHLYGLQLIHFRAIKTPCEGVNGLTTGWGKTGGFSLLYLMVGVKGNILQGFVETYFLSCDYSNCYFNISELISGAEHKALQKWWLLCGSLHTYIT